MSSALPFPPEVRTVTRWCIAVVRGDGATIEILPHLYHERNEAERQAEYRRTEWRGVTVQSAKCLVSVAIGEESHAGK